MTPTDLRQLESTLESVQADLQRKKDSLRELQGQCSKLCDSIAEIKADIQCQEVERQAMEGRKQEYQTEIEKIQSQVVNHKPVGPDRQSKECTYGRT